MNKKLQFKYTSIDIGDFQIHFRTLKDKNQFSDIDNTARDLGISSAQWSLFGVLWPSGMILAHYMGKYEIEGKRILETGCGTALASLVLKARGADVMASDYHPEAENFLRENERINELEPMPFSLSDWTKIDDGIGEFDLIIGSDILYEVEHIEALSKYINAHAKEKSEVIIVDPNRGQHNKFKRELEAMGFTHSLINYKDILSFEEEFKGKIHRFTKGYS